MSVKRQKKKKPTARQAAESKKAALITSVLAVVLLICTITYILWIVATERHTHVYIWVVLANLFPLFLAGYLAWEWRRLKSLGG